MQFTGWSPCLSLQVEAFRSLVYLREVGLFVFSELFDHPLIKSLDEKDASHDLAMLRLFCYGTYNDYKAAKTSYPPLTPLQVRKLRQLSIISACYLQKLIPYDHLLQMLELSSLRELEDLIIELFYLEAACGKLDQQKGLLVVESAIGRDLRETELPKLRSDLEAWCNRVDVVVSEVVGEMEKAKKIKHDWELGRTALTEKINLLNSLGKKDAGKFDVSQGSALPFCYYFKSHLHASVVGRRSSLYCKQVEQFLTVVLVLSLYSCIS
ncbi:unnamed protein product [Dibothriocephalus latus]|uniref:PCI domain-containing protein n=1 Tax=Dibothriocephalus latus TaxID=60516 RepID=A0A3P7M7Y7_DIBLA|nr:unnamed protein product [Dibothriocephalus latus]